jgi:hypothetical protein
VLARVRLRARLRAAWLDERLRHQEQPEAPTAAAGADDGDDPEAEAAWLAAAGWEQDLGLTAVEKAIEDDEESRLASVCRILGLGPADVDVLHVCLAHELDPALGRVFACLNGRPDLDYVTDSLVARLFGRGRVSVWSSAAALQRWELVGERPVGPADPPRLVCDRWIRAWLQGEHHLDEALRGAAWIHAPLRPLDGWDVDGVAALVQRVVTSGAGRVRLLMVGPPGAGRRTFAAVVAARLRLPLLVLDADLVDDAAWPRVFLRAQRQAFLGEHALAWTGAAALQRPWPVDPPAFPVQFVISESHGSLLPFPGGVDHAVEIPAPVATERRALWLTHVPRAERWPATGFERLVAKHRVTPGDVARAAGLGVTGAEEASRVIRELGRDRLGPLAQPLYCPFRWDDLVVPHRLREALEDLVFEARDRQMFWEQDGARRLFPQGRGLIALFTGPPGTGKTMAAQVLAGELSLDLFRVDLSSVVSKYVGETSQNLERILSRAAHVDAVLLFDEADALFGRRTEINDAHDRFANTDTNYLLQAIESYPGMAVLASNQRHNLDPAFVRRLRSVLEFPAPEAEHRLLIWRRVVAGLAGPAVSRRLAADLEALAGGIEMTGAQIKFSCLSGVFRARRWGRPLGPQDLLDGVERELAKEGRGVSDRDRARMFGHGS